jgi:hypothetical protein
MHMRKQTRKFLVNFIRWKLHFISISFFTYDLALIFLYDTPLHEELHYHNHIELLGAITSDTQEGIIGGKLILSVTVSYIVLRNLTYHSWSM